MMEHKFVAITAENSDLAFSLHMQGQPSPWSRKIFDDCLTPPYFAYYLEVNSKVVGYFVAMKVADEVTLMDIGVAKNCRGSGYGRVILDYCMQLSEAEKAQQIWLEVRQSNITAITLYESVGFNVIETRQHYYLSSEGKEDALIMCLQLAW